MACVAAVVGVAACGGGREEREPASTGEAAGRELGGARAALPASLRMAALRAAQEAPGHAFEARADGALTARIGAPGELARVEVAGERIAVAPAGGGFALGVRTVRVGRQGAARGAEPVRSVRAEGQEAVLEREGVEERYLAGPMGLEQSYRIEARPEGAGRLAIEVAFDGLAVQPAPSYAGVVRLADGAGTTRAVYRDVAAVDAEGRELGARMVPAEHGVTLLVEDEGAAYPVVVDPLIVTQQAKLTANDGVIGDVLGHAVSLSGDTALLGASGALNGTGAAYVFVRHGAGWSQQAKLIASDGHGLGTSVSLSGDTALVGAPSNGPGSAFVFVRNGTTWSQQAMLTNGAQGSSFGWSVSVSGDTAIVGAYQAGTAHVFVRSGTSWSQQAQLTASDGGGDNFGMSVSVSGDLALVGAPVKAGYAGAAYVFARSGATWWQASKLVASDAVGGALFGWSASLSGETALVGSLGGAAYVFVPGEPSWAQQAKLVAGDGEGSFGVSVSLSGDTALVGADSGDNGKGAAYVVARRGTTWSQQAKLTSNDPALAYGSQFGGAVSVSGATALVGADWIGAVVINGSAGAAFLFSLERPLGEHCGGPDECSSGFCADGVCCDAACDAGPCDACSIAAGAAVDGTCAALTGPACDDGDACTKVDACVAGACVGGHAVTCAAADQCHAAGTCDPSTGACSSPAKPDGSPCASGICASGVCGSTSGGSTSGGPTSGGSTSGGSTSGGSTNGGEASSSSSSEGGDAEVNINVSGGCRAAAGDDASGGAWLCALGLALTAARRRRGASRRA
jgi:hypothetical protein